MASPAHKQALRAGVEFGLTPRPSRKDAAEMAVLERSEEGEKENDDDIPGGGDSSLSSSAGENGDKGSGFVTGLLEI